MTQNYTHELIASSPHLPIYSSIYDDAKQLTPSHWHTHIEILFPLEGTLDITVHDQEHNINQHDVFIVNANDIHGTKSNDYIKVFMLQIPYDYLSMFISDFANIRFCEHLNKTLLLQNEFFQDLQNELIQLSTIFSLKDYGYEFEFMTHLHHFFHILYLHFSTRLDKPVKEAKYIAHLKEALNYISAHYMEPLSLAEVADIAALNQEYFCRIFKKYTGNTFLEYVNLTRLTHIYDDLLATDNSITDLLEQHGFTNYKVFSRMFKDTYGNTPAAFRHQIKQSNPITK